MKKLIICLLLGASSIGFAAAQDKATVTCADVAGTWTGTVDANDGFEDDASSYVSVTLPAASFDVGKGNITVSSQDGREQTQDFRGQCSMQGNNAVMQLTNGMFTYHNITITLTSPHQATLSGTLFSGTNMSVVLKNGQITK